MPPEPTTQPAPAPQPATDPPPADPAPAPPAGDPAQGDPPDDGPQFANDRDKRRWAELTGRVGKFARERDEARARIEALQWREVERLAGDVLAVPADVRMKAASLGDLIDPESGDVDPARVQAVLGALLEERPGLRKTPGPSALPGAHGGIPAATAPPTLASALARMTRGGR